MVPFCDAFIYFFGFSCKFQSFFCSSNYYVKCKLLPTTAYIITKTVLNTTDYAFCNYQKVSVTHFLTILQTFVMQI